MRNPSEAPIVSFARDGQVFELGRSGLSPILHKYGSTGLGIAPTEIESSDRIAGDGSIVRGVRYGARDVFIPLRMEAESMGALSELRRSLSALLAPHRGEIEIRVVDPATGTDRNISGLLKDGLSGDFGTGYHGYWQHLGLTFECPDPWWLGPERTRTLQVAPGSKPFLSETVSFFPVVLAPSSIVGEFEVQINGDGEVWPTWEIAGPGSDLTIQRGDERIYIDGEFAGGSVTRIQTRPRRISPDRWDDVSLDSKLFPLRPGANRLRITMVGATPDTLVRLVWQERYLEGL